MRAASPASSSLPLPVPAGGTQRMVAAMLISGTMGLFVVLSGQSPFTVVFFRCLIGGSALLGWLAWTGGWKPLDRRAALWLAGGGVALIGNSVALFAAYSLSSISIATVIYHLQPFFLVLLAALDDGRAPDARKLLWLAVALAGVALTTGITLDGGQPLLIGGVLLALLAAFLYAVAIMATRKLVGYAPAQIAGLQFMLGIVLVAPLTNFSLGELGWQSWGSLLTLGLLHTGILYALMYAAFQRLPADRIALLSFIYPLVAVLADIAVFRTTLSLPQCAGMLLILGALLANRAGKPPQ